MQGRRGDPHEHGAALAAGEVIELEDLPEEVARPDASQAGTHAAVRLRPLAEVEREHILGVFEACAGSVGDAARILDIGRNTLWRKLKRWS